MLGAPEQNCNGIGRSQVVFSNAPPLERSRSSFPPNRKSPASVSGKSDTGLAGYQIEKVSRNGDYAIEASFGTRPSSCPKCGAGRLVSKGPFSRVTRHLDAFGHRSWMHIRLRRWQCKDCRRTFVPELPGLRPGHRSTEPFRKTIYESHHDGVCAARLARRAGLGAASIGRIYAEFTYLKAQERRNQSCPRVLGIDEHTLHRGQRFVTTFCNLKNRRVFDVVEGKGQADLEAFLSTLKDREKVKAVCIDLSSSYRQMIRRWFPNAKMVADRFHVIRIIQHHFLAFCRMLVPELKKRRGLLKALRKNPENLIERDQERLQAFLRKQPVIKELYEKQLKLRELLKLKTLCRESCRQRIPELTDLLAELTSCGLEAMKTLSNTLKAWLEETVRMWRFTRSNGITEGFHRKMKLIQRVAYGFRNFDNYCLRVIALCG